MRVLILTHPRSGGMSLMNFIQKELDYNQYHEPFNNDEINTKIFVEDNIVVKDFPNHIKQRGYDINDVISKFCFEHRRNTAQGGSVCLVFKFVNHLQSGHPTQIATSALGSNIFRFQQLQVPITSGSNNFRFQ